MLKLNQSGYFFYIIGAISVLTTLPVRAEGEQVLTEVKDTVATEIQPSAGFARVGILRGDQSTVLKATRGKTQVPITEIPNISNIILPHTSVKDLLAQAQQNELTQVTGVRLNQTKSGLEIILETRRSDKLQTKIIKQGNNFVADIPNAQVRLTNGNSFYQDNPALGITAIAVINQDKNSIQVKVTGKEGVPNVRLFDSNKGLIFRITTVASTTQQPPTSQAKPSNETNEPIEIVVTGTKPGEYLIPEASTATKIPVPLSDIPQSIQVIPRQVIEDRAVVRQDELADNVSGVHPQIGFGEASGYVIRGFFNGYENLRNGFRDLGAIAPRGLANVEQTEFLKGPAAVLYGGGFAQGGIVNTVTKKPLDTPFYNIDFTVGNNSFYYPKIDITGPLTADNSLSYRLNASYENADSYRDFTGQETYFIAPALTWKIDSKTTFSTEVEYLNSNYTFESGFPLAPASLRLPVNRYLSEPGLNRTNVDSTSITYNIEHKFSDDWKVRQGFNAVMANTDIGNARLYGETLEADGQTLDRTSEQGPQSTQNYTLQNEIFGKFNTGSVQHNILFGVELSRYDYSYRAFGATLAPINIFNPIYGAQPGVFTPLFAGEYGSDNLGVYFQDLVKILPNLKLLGGGRFDLNDSFYKDSPNGLLINEQTETRFSPRLGIVYQPFKSTSLYFNWSNYFSPQFFGKSRTNQVFKPDISEQFEVGIKQDFFENQLNATLALYQITRQNVLTPDPVNNNFSIQTGEQKSRGVELDVVGQVLPGWKIITTYAYTDAFVSKDNLIPVGNQLVGAPSNSASLWTTYELQRGNFKGLGFGLGLVYEDDVQVALPNTFKAPSYLRTDLAIFYRKNKFRIGLNLKNLFDVKYFYTDGGYRIYPAPPLTILGTLSMQF